MQKLRKIYKKIISTASIFVAVTTIGLMPPVVLLSYKKTTNIEDPTALLFDTFKSKLLQQGLTGKNSRIPDFQTFISNSSNFLLSPLVIVPFFSALHLLKNGIIMDKYVLKNLKDYDVEVSIFGLKDVVYFGGLFWQDKIAWIGEAYIQYKKKDSDTFYKPQYPILPDSITLNVHTSFSGLGSPSFQVGAGIENSGRHKQINPKLTASVQIKNDSNSIIQTISNRRSDKIIYDYEGVGWMYKIFSSNQYVKGEVKLNHINTIDATTEIPILNKERTDSEKIRIMKKMLLMFSP
ncbi:hypothetical protein [Mesomycoplasma dispar]|uniref:Uncharacterized protein n=1 Tax=Mesomycoplasma dispar TaxID=86660 RepID=A0ABM6PS47_9BACT|nr:hypothetical protein [Mesomycoplasma dispar]ATP59970.1 hypothetical protein CSW10_03560 [Mesomycoplasma dispar]